MTDPTANESLLREAVANAEQRGTAAQLGNSLDHLAMHYHSAGKWNEAAHVYQRALRVWASVMGDTHPMLAPILSNLASVLFELGQPTYSAQYMGRAVEVLRADGSLDDDISGVVESATELLMRLRENHSFKEAQFLSDSLYGAADEPDIEQSAEIHETATVSQRLSR